jgi:hypothetical protein
MSVSSADMSVSTVNITSNRHNPAIIANKPQESVASVVENPQESIDIVHGIRIACPGEMAIYSQPLYTSINIPITHDLFKNPSVIEIHRSEILSHIGIPILAYDTGPDLTWNTSSGTAWKNETAASLFKSAHHDTLSKIPARFESEELGSVVVVRQDKKALSVEHIAALCGFCKHISPETLRDVKKEDFEKYWDLWKVWNGKKDVESPYDI